MLAELGDPPAAGRDGGAWVKGLREKEDQVWEMRRQWLHSDAVPIHPLRLCHEMAAFVDDETLVVGDGGDIVNLAAQVLPINHPGQWFDPGPMGTLGVGTGFSMAAKIACPEKKVLMVNGDGTFGLNGFEFDTFVRHNLPVVSVVGNDRQWGQITVGQVQMYGRERAVASILADNARYDRVVEALGGHGEFVTEPAQIPARHREGVRLRQAGLRQRHHGPGAAGRPRRLRVHVAPRVMLVGVELWLRLGAGGEMEREGWEDEPEEN